MFHFSNMKSALTFRFAEPSDAESFVKWATENAAIDFRDMADSMKVNNPTCVTLVVERDGVPILFSPFYATMTLAYLGFNPDRDDPRERLEALETMLKAMSAFATLHGVREIGTFTNTDQMVAKWALRHGFKKEERSTFRYKIHP